MKRLALCCAVLFAATICLAQQPKLISIGQIRNIDAKGKSLTIEIPGDGRFRRRRNGLPPSNAANGPAGNTSAPLRGLGNLVQSKVLLTAATLYKDGDNNIKLDDLKVGDRVQVVAVKKGRNLQAADIIRMKQGSLP